MFVGAIYIELYLPSVNSLKDKRKIIKSILDRLRNRYNISVAEIDCQDVWQKSTIGISYINSKHSEIDIMLETILNFIKLEKDVSILDYEKYIY
jgi:uncharacterized protein YlxP (DUF503 family)